MQYFELLSKDEVIKIHDTSLDVLENVGVLMNYQPAKDLLAKHGAKIEGSIVRFPKGLVEECLRSIPSSFTLYARNPQNNLVIDTDALISVGPYGTPFVQDIDHGRRKSRNEDFINAIKILHSMDTIDVIAYTSTEPGDIPVEKRSNHIVYNNFKYTDKPVYGSIVGAEAANDAIDMAAVVFGGRDVIKEKPGIIASACTLSPLAFDEETLAGIMVYAAAAQPLLITTMSIAGATAPATLVGCAVLQNAEILSGIVLAQCVNPGTPLIYSGVSSNADMRTGAIANGSAEGCLISLITAQLSRFYHMPNRESGGITDSKILDTQATLESTLSATMNLISGGNFIQNSVGILDSYTCLSFEKLIVDCEALSMIKRIKCGLTVDDNTLAYDVICEAGPMGQYVTAEHTFRNFRNEFSVPTLCDRQNTSQWENSGALTMEQRANMKWKQILAEYEEPVFPSGIEAELKRIAEK